MVRHFRRRILKKTFDSLYMRTDGAENESLEFLLKVHFFAVGQYLADRFLITKSLCVKKRNGLHLVASRRPEYIKGTFHL